MSERRFKLGLVGARGYVGAELVKLLVTHPMISLDFVSSREWAGMPLCAQWPWYPHSKRFVALDAEAVASSDAQIIVLAMPNGAAKDYVAAIERLAPDKLIVDLSADYRFDDDWFYGLPEHTRDRYAGQRRISNPGCYATAMQLLLAPLADVLHGPAQCFGVSGYSGAGTSPSDKNNPAKLHDNLIPYSLVGHIHEREVSRHTHAVQFMPHVAAHFRGLTITANMTLADAMDRDAVQARYREAYAGEPLIALQDEAPWVSTVAGRHGAHLGGFTADASGERWVGVCVLDNLLKGAATQALQNIHLALGIDELTGIPHD
ncbi:MAG: N-acetyl-gamma-glutamyl-phosphate reductase [Xanthomonadales bacterium]|nr:N-acetyl-gamma-glutamyl-phosphate reductase [Xanthomonadales bacterium]